MYLCEQREGCADPHVPRHIEDGPVQGEEAPPTPAGLEEWGQEVREGRLPQERWEYVQHLGGVVLNKLLAIRGSHMHSSTSQASTVHVEEGNTRTCTCAHHSICFCVSLVKVYTCT